MQFHIQDILTPSVLMKRKARHSEGADETSHAVAVKSLRTSISHFLEQNDATYSDLTDRLSPPRADFTNKCWSQYATRIRSFNVACRLSIPIELSPSICARHGWKSTGEVGFIQCDDCKKLLCISMFAKDSTNASTRLHTLCTKLFLYDK